MQKIVALLPALPPGLAWQRIESSDKYLYRWQLDKFKNLRLESPIARPFEQIWEIRPKRDDGKNRERSHSYPLNLRLQLIARAEIPTHQLNWQFSTGKLAILPDCNAGSVIFSELGIGWLLVQILEF